MQKPNGIDLTAGLMGLFLLLGIVLLFLAPLPAMPANAQGLPMSTMVGAIKGVTVVVVLIELLIVFFYWKGQNWARWLVMIGSALTLLGLFGLPKTLHTFLPAALLTIVKVLLAIYLLYFLNTAPVAAWFTAPKTGLPPESTAPPQYGV